MDEPSVQSKGHEQSVPSKSNAEPSPKKTTYEKRPNTAAVLTVFLICVGMSFFILVFRDLRNNPFAEILAGLMMLLAISVILFSVVSSSTRVRAVVGLGGAALFYYMLWPQVEKAIHPPPSTQVIRGNIYFINDKNDLGLRPVQGAEVRVANTVLKSIQSTGETGDFTIFDAPSEVKELDVLYKGRVYAIDLSKFYGTARYAVIPSDSLRDTTRISPDQELRAVLTVDATLEIAGPHWDRIVHRFEDRGIQVPDIGGTARARVCGLRYGDYILDDTRPGFTKGLRIGSLTGTGNHRESWDGNCLTQYAEGRGGSSWTRGLDMALKKLVQGTCGRVQTSGVRLIYSGVSQVPLDYATALGPCTGSDLPEPPEWKTTVVLKREDGSIVDTLHFVGFQQYSGLGGTADFWMNASGLLTIVLKQDQQSVP